ncbi:MAG: hypothetical protein HRT45_11405 [Bdellovibrionales bacterium]|nr:hypothetical protein [Bdellovibrionales bacterium]
MLRTSLLIFSSALLLVGCGSSEKMADDPAQDSEIQSSEPADFEDESLFEVDGAQPVDKANYDPELGEESASSAEAPQAAVKSDGDPVLDTGEDQPSFPAPADEALPEPEPKPEAVATAQKSTDKAAMRRLKSDCNMRSIASAKGKKYKTLSKGKKLWTEPHNDKWFKVYRSKNVAAYLSKSCF